MLSKINPLEKRQERDRMKKSLIVSFLFHIILLLVISVANLLTFSRKEKEIVVVTVKLHDKLIEDFNKLDEINQKKIIDKNKVESKKIIKKIEKKKKDMTKVKNNEEVSRNRTEEKNSETKKFIEENTDNNLVEKESEESKSEESKFDKYSDEKNKERLNLEREFLSKSEFSDKKRDNDGDISNILDNININNSKSSNNVNNNENIDNDGIRWEGGKKRSLLRSDLINPPEEISFLGLKTGIIIEFEVYENGLIGKVKILESTGNTSWDYEIIEQFKRNYKFFESNGKSIGTIQINIGY